jgi:hypothetical protein
LNDFERLTRLTNEKQGLIKGEQVAMEKQCLDTSRLKILLSKSNGDSIYAI